MQRLRSLFLVCLALCLTLAQAAELNDGKKFLPQADREIEQDLENVLVTPMAITADIQRQNLSLLEAAIQYDKMEAIYSLLASTVVAFLVIKDPVRVGALYIVNGLRFLRAMRTGESIATLTYIEGSTAIATTSFALSGAASLAYMSTTLFQKGVCMFNCVENFSARVTDARQQEFLESPTYQKIAKEIGTDRAMQFVVILKEMRDQSFGNEDSMRSMIRFVDEVNGAKLSSIDQLNMKNAPTFTRAIQVINGVYNLNSLVVAYLMSSGQAHLTARLRWPPRGATGSERFKCRGNALHAFAHIGAKVFASSAIGAVRDHAHLNKRNSTKLTSARASRTLPSHGYGTG